MMAVRRPGRPLSACPHLPGAQCHCRWQSNNGNTSTVGGDSQGIIGPAALTPDPLPDPVTTPVHDHHPQNKLYYPQTLPSQVATDPALPTLPHLGYLPPDQLASPYDINMSTFPHWHPLNSPESPHVSLDINYAQHHHPGHATDSYTPFYMGSEQQEDWWSSSSHDIGDAYSCDTVTGTGTGTGVFTDIGFPDESRHDMSDDEEQHHGENEIRPGQNLGSTTTAGQSTRPNQ